MKPYPKAVMKRDVIFFWVELVVDMCSNRLQDEYAAQELNGDTDAERTTRLV